MSPVVILPGLDGTDRLLDRFVAAAPPAVDVTVVALPDDPTLDYNALCEYVAAKLSDQPPCHLIAESFSGPTGILLAHRHPDRVSRLTLVASFATSPAPRIARWLPWSLILRLRPLLWAARARLVGVDREAAELWREAVRSTSVATLAQRIHCLLDVDVRAELTELACPVQYLRPRRDRLVPARALQKVVKAKPSVTVHEIDGPHLILQTRPQEAWQAILAEAS